MNVSGTDLTSISPPPNQNVYERNPRYLSGVRSVVQTKEPALCLQRKSSQLSQICPVSSPGY